MAIDGGGDKSYINTESAGRECQKLSWDKQTDKVWQNIVICSGYRLSANVDKIPSTGDSEYYKIAK